MDYKQAQLHKAIFKRSIVPWPPLNKPYIPDPVRWSRLNSAQKQGYITKANNAIEYSIDNTTIYKYNSRAELYADVVIPPGFETVQDVLGAIARDKFAL